MRREIKGNIGLNPSSIVALVAGVLFFLLGAAFVVCRGELQFVLVDFPGPQSPHASTATADGNRLANDIVRFRALTGLRRAALPLSVVNSKYTVSTQEIASRVPRYGIPDAETRMRS
jgi:hypothetical protein